MSDINLLLDWNEKQKEWAEVHLSIRKSAVEAWKQWTDFLKGQVEFFTQQKFNTKPLYDSWRFTVNVSSEKKPIFMTGSPSFSRYFKAKDYISIRREEYMQYEGSCGYELEEETYRIPLEFFTDPEKFHQEWNIFLNDTFNYLEEIEIKVKTTELERAKSLLVKSGYTVEKLKMESFI